MTKDLDRAVIVVMAILIFMGLVTIFSATQARGLPFWESYLARQLASVLIALAVFYLSVKISYQRFIDASYIFYAVNIMLLLFVLIAGRARFGAQRWFSIGGFAFQPSEFIKINLILVLASYLGVNKNDMARPSRLVVPLILLFLPFALVLIQPDLGTAILLLPIFLSLVYVGGARARYILGMIFLGVCSAPFMWHLLKGYQKQRLLVFLNPNIDPLGAGYTIIQSKIAAGSGGLFGKGWLNGSQNQLNFLPERHTDFIFSVFGEEFGFLGAALAVLLYFYITKKAFEIASSTSDMCGKAIATGVGVMFGLQVVINIGMTIGLMPVVGVPLPLFSYGGSSLLANLIALGLLLNVSMRRSRF